MSKKNNEVEEGRFKLNDTVKILTRDNVVGRVNYKAKINGEIFYTVVWNEGEVDDTLSAFSEEELEPAKSFKAAVNDYVSVKTGKNEASLGKIVSRKRYEDEDYYLVEFGTGEVKTFSVYHEKDVNVEKGTKRTNVIVKSDEIVCYSMEEARDLLSRSLAVLAKDARGKWYLGRTGYAAKYDDNDREEITSFSPITVYHNGVKVIDSKPGELVMVQTKSISKTFREKWMNICDEAIKADKDVMLPIILTSKEANMELEFREKFEVIRAVRVGYYNTGSEYYKDPMKELEMLVDLQRSMVGKINEDRCKSYNESASDLEILNKYKEQIDNLKVEIKRAECAHKDEQGNETLKQNDDGTVTCTECGKNFVPEDSKGGNENDERFEQS